MEKPEIVQTKFQKFLRKLAVVSFFTWIVTVSLFILAVVSNAQVVANPLLGNLLLGDIVLGIVAFLSAILANYISKPRPITETKSILATLGFGLAALMTMVVLAIAIPAPKPLNQVQLNSPRPSPDTSQQLSPAPTTKATGTQIKPKTPQITCTGPDYKTFQATEAECIKFRQDWGLPASPAPIPTTAPQRQQQTQTNNYLCKVGSSGYTYYTKDANECTQSMLTEMNRNSCLDTAKNELSSCQSACDKPYNEGKTACAWAYTGNNPGIELNSTKYNECLDELYGTWTSCRDVCMNAYPTALSKCK